MSKPDLERRITTDRAAFAASADRPGDTSKILISAFDGDYLEPASYDVSVGDAAFILRRIPGEQPFMDRSTDEEAFQRMVREGKAFDLSKRRAFSVPPQEAVIICARGLIGIPNDVTAIVTTKLKYAFQGVIQPTSRIDPGFLGRLYVPWFNFGVNEITLREGEKLCNVVFLKLTSPGPARGAIDPDLVRKHPVLGGSALPPDQMTEEQILAELGKYGRGMDLVRAYMNKRLGKK